MSHDGVRVIGNRAGSPGPHGGASGYVLDFGGRTVLVDCGPGVVAELARRDLVDTIDAVVISHRHADHCLDLTALAFSRSFPSIADTIPLFAPAGFGEHMERVDAAFGIPSLSELASPLMSRFALTEITPGDAFELLGTTVRTVEARHPVPTLSMRFDHLDLVYTADTAMTPELIALTTGARVFLSEATYPSSEGRDLLSHGHMSGLEAGEVAARAGVGNLVLTHLADYEASEETERNARSTFDGPIAVASVGMFLHRGDSNA